MFSEEARLLELMSPAIPKAGEQPQTALASPTCRLAGPTLLRVHLLWRPGQPSRSTRSVAPSQATSLHLSDVLFGVASTDKAAGEQSDPREQTEVSCFAHLNLSPVRVLTADAPSWPGGYSLRRLLSSFSEEGSVPTLY